MHHYLYDTPLPQLANGARRWGIGAGAVALAVALGTLWLPFAHSRDMRASVQQLSPADSGHEGSGSPRIGRGTDLLPEDALVHGEEIQRWPAGHDPW